MSQKAVFLEGEGDAWFARNPKRIDCEGDPVVQAVARAKIAPTSILEIGSGGGYRLGCFRTMFGAACHGIDPSQAAVQRDDVPDGVSLRQGTADALPYADASFDLVVVGFCLYLCDPADHFRIAGEVDRVLRSPGFVALFDFNSAVPYRVPYAHKAGVYSHKMDWPRMFLWHPAYRMVSRSYGEHGARYTFAVNEAVVVDLLRKDSDAAFSVGPPPA